MTTHTFDEDKAECLAARTSDSQMETFTAGEWFALLLRSLSRSKG